MSHRLTPVCALVLALALAPCGCRDAAEVTDTFAPVGPGDTDMLWIIDNSASMGDAQIQLLDNFATFGNGLPAGTSTRLGLTTTQAWSCIQDISTEICDDVHGTCGMLRRHYGLPLLLDPSDVNDQALFRTYADVGLGGAQKERPLQVALMALCESVALPGTTDFIDGTDDLMTDFPHGCSGDQWDPDHPLYEPCHCLPASVDLEIAGQVVSTALHGANAGLQRGDTPLHVVVLTDEGDDSWTLFEVLESDTCADVSGAQQDGARECVHAELLRLLHLLAPVLRISVIGPGQGPDAVEELRYECNPEMNDRCALDFHFWSVTGTGGEFIPIQIPDEEVEGECDQNEFGPAMTDLLMAHPSTEWFHLSAYPEVGTIEVLLDDEVVPPHGSGTSCTDATNAEGGWMYDGERNAVSLFGDCTAFPPAVIDVSYTCLDNVITG